MIWTSQASGAHGGQSSGPRAADAVCDATHLRGLRDRGRCLPVRTRATHGTSVEQIDKTYGHLLSDAVEYERGLLDAFDGRESEAEAVER